MELYFPKFPDLALSLNSSDLQNYEVLELIFLLIGMV